VRVKSAGLSRGATFAVVLPIAALHSESEELWRQPQASRSSAGISIPNLQNVSVLVVDDDEDARTLLAKMLTKAGAKVRLVSSVVEAVEAVRIQPADVLISDIGMPDEDGLSLIRMIRRLPKGQGGDVPAIALTAYTRTEDRIRVIAEGFQMYIAKPADAVELLTMVESLAKQAKQ
jgi:CheY-like chemotaxis protein